MPDQSPQHEVGQAVVKIVPDLSALDEAKAKVDRAAEEWKAKLSAALTLTDPLKGLEDRLAQIADGFARKLAAAQTQPPAAPDRAAQPAAAPPAPATQLPPTPAPPPTPTREELKERADELTWQTQIVTLIQDLRTHVDAMRRSIEQLSLR